MRLPESFVFRDPLPLFNTWDLAYHDGRLYPNKPPGPVLLAVPAYWVLYHAERVAGIDVDGLWALAINLHLTTLLSVGIVGAMGAVVFLRTSRILFPEIGPRRHVAATLAFVLATPILPYATMLFDHVLAAVGLLAAFFLTARAASGDLAPRKTVLNLLAAGLCAGASVMMSYAALLGAVLILAYGAARGRPVTRMSWIVLGGILPAIALATYHLAAFGRVAAVANVHQPALFREPALWLGIFGVPDPGVIFSLLLPTYRGLLPAAPVLALSLPGLIWMAGRTETKLEAALFVSIFAAFLLMNASFNGWHGGYCFGPRYLLPAVPFLALPLALVARRIPGVFLAMAVLSCAVALLATAVTPMIPQDIRHPFSGFLWPLVRGGTVDTPLFRYVGPISANPAGVHGLEVLERWNSYNLGEAVWPGRRLSVLPLLLVWVGVMSLLWRWTSSPPTAARVTGTDPSRSTP